MEARALQDAVAQVPAGAWAVGVSGGADSVALLRLGAARPDLRLVVAHLNHETRGPESDGDADFVRSLCDRLGIACEIARRSEIEPSLEDPPNNASARYRACRRHFFHEVVRRHGLQGVLLAHQSDDQAETVLHKLLRGSGASNLTGMAGRASIGGLLVLRPLLKVAGQHLRDHLRAMDQPWREDASNAEDLYARNRHRRLLASRPGLTAALLDLSGAMRGLKDWTQAHAPALPDPVPLRELQAWPVVLRTEALRRWLIGAGAPESALDRRVMRRLLEMSTDAASPARQAFPGNVVISRRKQFLSVWR